MRAGRQAVLKRFKKTIAALLTIEGQKWSLYGLTQQSGKQKQNQVIQIKNLNLNIANLASGSRVNP